MVATMPTPMRAQTARRRPSWRAASTSMSRGRVITISRVIVAACIVVSCFRKATAQNRRRDGPLRGKDNAQRLRDRGLSLQICLSC